MVEVLPLIVAMLCWGVAPMFARLGLVQTDPLVGLTVRSIVVTTGVLLAAIFSGKLVLVAQVPTQSIMLLAADGLLAGLIDQFAIYWGLRLNETSRVVPFTSAYPIVTVLLARLYLGEHLTTGKMLGALLIVAGLFLVRK